MAGRIETYVHSDNATRNKAAAMVRVSCQTDFGARTPEFIDFCGKVAKFACGFQIEDPIQLMEGRTFPNPEATCHSPLVDYLKEVQEQIGETVTIEEMKVMTLAAEETQTEKRIQPTGKYAELAKKKKEAAKDNTPYGEGGPGSDSYFSHLD
jgi:translation elongation factor EF-Ts